ncbi:unnamed protein product [Prunus armeniaca]
MEKMKLQLKIFFYILFSTFNHPSPKFKKFYNFSLSLLYSLHFFQSIQIIVIIFFEAFGQILDLAYDATHLSRSSHSQFDFGGFNKNITYPNAVSSCLKATCNILCISRKICKTCILM